MNNTVYDFSGATITVIERVEQLNLAKELYMHDHSDNSYTGGNRDQSFTGGSRGGDGSTNIGGNVGGSVGTGQARVKHGGDGDDQAMPAAKTNAWIVGICGLVGVFIIVGATWYWDWSRRPQGEGEKPKVEAPSAAKPVGKPAKRP